LPTVRLAIGAIGSLFGGVLSVWKPIGALTQIFRTLRKATRDRRLLEDQQPSQLNLSKEEPHVQTVNSERYCGVGVSRVAR
jgi:hypothetical protein